MLAVTHRYGIAMYNKLFGKIVDSSIWLASDPVRLVWITFLAVMDEDGVVRLPTPANVAHRARVSLEDATEALAILESPEPSTATDDDDGRRIEKIPGGWIVLNAKKYREMATREIQRESTRLRVARHRAKKREEATGNGHVTPESRDVMQSEAEAYTEAEKSGAARPTDEIPNLDHGAWAVWIAYRAKLKLKKYADPVKMAKRLAKFPLNVQRAAVDESITQNWQGLFPEKVRLNGAEPKGNRESAYDRAGRQLREWAAANGVAIHPSLG